MTMAACKGGEVFMSRHPVNFGRVAWLLAHPSTVNGGRVRDLSGSQSDGVFQGGCGLVGKPRPGGFMRSFGGFSLSNGFINCGPSPRHANLALNPAMTVAAWVYFTATNVNSSVVGRGISSTAGWGMFLSFSGTWNLNFAASTTQVSVNAGSTGQAWFRLLFSVSTISYTTAPQAFLYVNGKQFLPTRTAGSGTNSSDVTANLQIGVAPIGGNATSGYIDDVSVWNRALTPQEAYIDYMETTAGYPRLLQYRSVAYALAPGPSTGIANATTFNASLPFAAAIQEMDAHPFNVSAPLAGTLTRSSAFLRGLTGALPLAGSLATKTFRVISLPFTAGLSLAGTVAERASKVIAAPLTLAGSLVRVAATHYLQTLTGALTLAGARAAKLVGKVLNRPLPLTGPNVRKADRVPLNVALPLAPVKKAQANKRFTTANLPLGRTFAASKARLLVFLAALPLGGGLASQVGKGLTTGLALTGDTIEFVTSILRRGNILLTTTLVNSASKTFTVFLGLVGFLAPIRSIGLVFAAALGLVARSVSTVYQLLNVPLPMRWEFIVQRRNLGPFLQTIVANLSLNGQLMRSQSMGAMQGFLSLAGSMTNTVLQGLNVTLPLTTFIGQAVAVVLTAPLALGGAFFLGTVGMILKVCGAAYRTVVRGRDDYK
jgi:hypothetical protein